MLYALPNYLFLFSPFLNTSLINIHIIDADVFQLNVDASGVVPQLSGRYTIFILSFQDLAFFVEQLMNDYCL